jgi:hypothetical protein
VIIVSGSGLSNHTFGSAGKEVHGVKNLHLTHYDNEELKGDGIVTHLETMLPKLSQGCEEGKKKKRRKKNGVKSENREERNNI